MYVLVNTESGESKTFMLVTDLLSHVKELDKSATGVVVPAAPPKDKVLEGFQLLLEWLKESRTDVYAKLVGSGTASSAGVAAAAPAGVPLTQLEETPPAPAAPTDPDAAVKSFVNKYLNKFTPDTPLLGTSGRRAPSPDRSIKDSAALKMLDTSSLKSEVTADEDVALLKTLSMEKRKTDIYSALGRRKNQPLQGAKLTEEAERIEFWFRTNFCKSRYTDYPTDRPRGNQFAEASWVRENENTAALYTMIWRLFLQFREKIFEEKVSVMIPETKLFECDLSELLDQPPSRNADQYTPHLKDFFTVLCIVSHVKPKDLKSDVGFIDVMYSTLVDYYSGRVTGLTLEPWIRFFMETRTTHEATESVKSSSLFSEFETWFDNLWRVVSNKTHLNIKTSLKEAMNQKVFTGVLKSTLGLRTVRKADGVYWPGLKVRKEGEVGAPASGVAEYPLFPYSGWANDLSVDFVDFAPTPVKPAAHLKQTEKIRDLMETPKVNVTGETFEKSLEVLSAVARSPRE